MIWQTVLALVIGILAGIITGLTPGIHVNLVSVFILAIHRKLLAFFTLMDIAVFLVAMSITHVFLDAVPSIYLGAPDSNTALGVLPGHRYLLQGNGYMAIKLTVVGNYFALLLSLALFPIAIALIGEIYDYIVEYIGYFLLVILVFMVIREKNLIWAIIVVLLSGLLGMIVLDMPMLEDPLFPMLSGLFGISTLLISLNDNQEIPPQKTSSKIDIDWKKGVKALLSGQFSGFITAVLPGICASTAAVISMQITRKLGDHGFMILMGAIGMVNFVLSLATYYTISKARNGVVVALAEMMGRMEMNDIMLMLASALIAASIGVWLSLAVAKVFSSLMTKMPYKKVVWTIIAFIALIGLALTGILGLVVMIVSTAIGLIPAIKKISRTHAMACLTVPVMVYFLV